MREEGNEGEGQRTLLEGSSQVARTPGQKDRSIRMAAKVQLVVEAQ